MHWSAVNGKDCKGTEGIVMIVGVRVSDYFQVLTQPCCPGKQAIKQLLADVVIYVITMHAQTQSN